jgi:DNA-binding CsgD family transcriptional regulator
MAYDIFGHAVPDALSSFCAEPLSVDAAYRIASGGSRQAIRSALEVTGRKQSTQRALLSAATDLLGGHVARGIHVLEGEVEAAPLEDRPYIIDLLAPLYVMSDRVDDLDYVLETVVEEHVVAAGIAALRVVRDARRGRRPAVRAAIEELTPYVHGCHDDLLAGKVAQRLALAAYYVKAYEQATGLAEQSAHAFGRAHAPRLAVTSYSIIYNVHHAVTGDCLESLRSAKLMTEFAEAAGDHSYRIIGLVAQYEIAAEMGDADRLQQLRAQIRRAPVPEQYLERFACRLADFLPFAWDDNFEALRAGITIARDALRLTGAMRALATSLMALADCALGNDTVAQQLARSAINLAQLSVPESEPAYDRRYRLLARAIAGTTCVLLRAADRGHRALGGKAFAGEPDLAGLVEVAHGRDYTELSIRNRGYGRAIQVARDRLLKYRGGVALTRTEKAVLQLLADGLTAPEIARLMGRSVFTVRSHTRSIIEKFDVSGRNAAVSQARKFGFLEDFSTKNTDPIRDRALASHNWLGPTNT